MPLYKSKWKVEKLHAQVEELRVQHEEENRIRSLKFEAEVDLLKQDIASAFEDFSDGKLCAEDLLVCIIFTTFTSYSLVSGRD